MQQGIAKGDALLRLTGISFIIGAIVTAVFNILAPRSGDPTNMQAAIQLVAANKGFFQVDQLLLAVGILAIMIGIAGVYRSISNGGAAAWARVGFYGVIVGIALWTARFGMAMGSAELAEQWQVATGADKATLFLVISSVHYIVVALQSMAVIVYWLFLVFLGIGMVLSEVYPKWLGGVLIVLGVATVVVVGVPQALAGESQTSQLLFAILSVLTLLWALVMGIWITRKAW
jgi:hypothetical protein